MLQLESGCNFDYDPAENLALCRGLKTTPIAVPAGQRRSLWSTFAR